MWDSGNKCIVLFLSSFYFGSVISFILRMTEENLSTTEEAFRKMSKTALVFGYTGQTGQALVKELAQRNLYSKVKLAGRRNVEFDDNRKDMVGMIQSCADL